MLNFFHFLSKKPFHLFLFLCGLIFLIAGVIQLYAEQLARQILLITLLINILVTIVISSFVVKTFLKRKTS